MSGARSASRSAPAGRPRVERMTRNGRDNGTITESEKIETPDGARAYLPARRRGCRRAPHRAPEDLRRKSPPQSPPQTGWGAKPGYGGRAAPAGRQDGRAKAHRRRSRPSASRRKEPRGWARAWCRVSDVGRHPAPCARPAPRLRANREHPKQQENAIAARIRPPTSGRGESAKRRRSRNATSAGQTAQGGGGCGGRGRGRAEPAPQGPAPATVTQEQTSKRKSSEPRSALAHRIPTRRARADARSRGGGRAHGAGCRT